MDFLNPEKFIGLLKLALCVDLPYENRGQELARRSAQITPAAVLLLFGYSTQSREKGPFLLLIRRAETVETHKGQMAFPGGVCETGDCNEPETTALRETEEEVGISPSDVQVLGMLPLLITSTAFSIRPAVGILTKPIDHTPLKLDKAETAEAIWIPLHQFLDPETYRREYMNYGIEAVPIDVFQVSHHRIWGATGSLVKNMLDRFSMLEQGSLKFCGAEHGLNKRGVIH